MKFGPIVWDPRRRINGDESAKKPALRRSNRLAEKKAATSSQDGVRKAVPLPQAPPPNPARLALNEPLQPEEQRHRVEPNQNRWLVHPAMNQNALHGVIQPARIVGSIGILNLIQDVQDEPNASSEVAHPLHSNGVAGPYRLVSCDGRIVNLVRNSPSPV